MAMFMQQKTPELQQQNALVANGISDISSSASSIPIGSPSQVPPLSDATPLKLQTNQIYSKNLNINNLTAAGPPGIFPERQLTSPKSFSLQQVSAQSRDLGQSRSLGVPPNIQDSQTSRKQNRPDLFNDVTRTSSLVAGGNQVMLPSPVSLKKRQSISHANNHLMTAEEAKPLIASLKVDEKLIYIARHTIGGLNENGFQRAISNVEKLKKRLLKTGVTKKGKNKRRDDGLIPSSNQPLIPNNDDGRSALKSNPDVVKGMMIEMGLGVTYCESLMTTIKSLIGTLGSNGFSTDEVKSGKLGNKRTQTYRGGRKHVTKAEDLTETMKEGNGRKRKIKEEKAYSRCEMSRFRTLRSGDLVAVKPQTNEPLFLARVVAHWEGLNCSPHELSKMPVVSTA
jgi:hypothetical protein